jgi:hypothetical protein
LTLRAFAAKALPALNANQPRKKKVCVSGKREREKQGVFTEPHQGKTQKDKRNVVRCIDVFIVITTLAQNHGIGHSCQSTRAMHSDSPGKKKRKENA